MRTVAIKLRFSFKLDTKQSTTEAQIRSFLASYQASAEAALQTLVDAAPPAAQATLDSTGFHIDPFSRYPDGYWLIELCIYPTVTVADTVTDSQIRNYLAGYWDDAKNLVRNIVDAAPQRHQAAIPVVPDAFHVHRPSGGPSDEWGP